MLTRCQGQKDNDGSKGQEESSAKVKGEAGVGVTVGIVPATAVPGAVGVVMVLLGIGAAAAGLIGYRRWGLCLLGTHSSEEEEKGKRNSQNYVAEHVGDSRILDVFPNESDLPGKKN